MKIDFELRPQSLQPAIDQFWQLSAQKISLIEKNFDTSKGAPVFTVNGKYTTRGWTEWTQGFQFGSAVLQYDATGDKRFLEVGRNNTVTKMAPHITHRGVHDHGFNNVSTYGNLLRLMKEGKVAENKWEQDFYELALKSSGAVQAMRWTSIKDGGYIYSFNGPHSLFVDTVRSCRALMVAHQLGHHLGGENDVKISLLDRAIQHLQATAKYSVFYGEGRDTYDTNPGRTAHECIFNVNDGNYRCPNSQQGFSGFTTWTRGLAWAMCGFAEQLEFLATIDESDYKHLISKQVLEKVLLRAAQATCDFYIQFSAADGIPYWDTGAPGLSALGNFYNIDSQPFNDHEPVDSSAAAIGAQGLLRLGNYLYPTNKTLSTKYTQAAYTIARTLLNDRYLSLDPKHEGLILHSVYHRPNGWDNIPAGKKIPCGESSMWGDYHARELILCLTKMNKGEPYLAFYNCVQDFQPHEH